jgi:hypothetical protein
VPGPADGKTLWQDRGGAGSYWGSIVVAAGRCYLTARNGTTVVFRPEPRKFELLASNALGEDSNSTPAISNGEIFIRTFKNLYCIRGQSRSLGNNRKTPIQQIFLHDLRVLRSRKDPPTTEH